MRLSNGVARLENGIGFLFNKAGVAAENLRCAVSDKFATTKLEVRAAQLAQLRASLRTLPPLDRQEVELRASEIAMIRDATQVRRQEAKLRREIARRIRTGELSYTAFLPQENTHG